MANTFTNTSWVSMEILRLLINKLEVAEQFATNWDPEFKKEFPVGATITVKKPQRFLIRTGMGYTGQGLVRETTTISLDQVFGIDFEWDDYEKAVLMERGIEQLRKNYLDPAASKLAQEVESRCSEFAYLNTPNVMGVLGTNPTTSAPFLAADARLFDKSCPDGDRKLILTSAMMASFVGAQTVQFQPSSEIAQQYKKGVVGMAHGFEWYRSNSLYRHTAGTMATNGGAGSFVVTGAGQTGSSLIITGAINETLKKGDVFSIANVNFVNPNTLRVPAGNQVQHFVVLQDYTMTGGADTISIYPAIKGPGSQYQNVDALAINGAVITVWPGTAAPSAKSGAQGLVLSKYAFGLVGAKFEMPKAVELAQQTRDPETGLSVRFTRQWDIQDSKYKNRFDMCLGFGVLYADEGAVRVVGA